MKIEILVKSGHELRSNAVLGLECSGVMAIQLQNITGGITQTPAGVNNSVSINLHTSASGSWLPLNSTFATPTISPSGGYQIFVGTTTAITSGTSCYVDSVSMTQPSRFGSVGPYMSIFAGSSTNYNGDTVNTVITNAGSVTGDWQWAMARLGITSGSTILPSSGSPTISNTLIS